MTLEVSIDRDLELRLKKFANGVGISVEDVVEAAVHYALRSRYPDNSLPSGGRPDNTLPGSQPHPDQGLPGGSTKPVDPGFGQGGANRPDNSLPRPPFDPEVEIDNELPEGEVPVEIDNSLPGYNPNLNPNLDPNLSAGQGSGTRPDQGLPPTATPKG